MKAGHISVCLVLAGGMAAAQAPVVTLTATADNVKGAPDSIRIDVLRWSTDAERDQILSAWTQPRLPGAGGRGGRAGRGALADPAPDPSAVDDGSPVAGGRGAGRGGRGGGRGGRGGRGGDTGAAEAPKPTPEGSLKAALGNTPIVGHLWSSEVAGYSLRSAVTLAEANGGERILLITDRRLGAWNDLWTPAGTDAANGYEFSIIDLRLNAKGEGEGKVSLIGKVAVDGAVKTIALENYDSLPVVLKNVRRK
jgi:hypothetical protein